MTLHEYSNEILETICDYQPAISETETTERSNVYLKHKCTSRIYVSIRVYKMKITVEFTTIVKNHSVNINTISKEAKSSFRTPLRHEE